MDIRIITLRYSDGIQGFPEEPLHKATAGREVLEAREHFFVHGNVPHMAVVLLLGDTGEVRRRRPPGPDPAEDLSDDRKSLYRDLRSWRNERAKTDGVPSYVIARNVQVAEICKRLPRTMAELKEIEGIGEATCEKYGRDILARIPEDMPRMSANPSEAEKRGDAQ
jgi:superfamily II DNA helicase RecQ